MKIEVWDGDGPVLADTSAWMVARRVPRARKLLLEAQRSGLDVLHYDRHFDRLGELLGIRTIWVAEPSS